MSIIQSYNPSDAEALAELTAKHIEDIKANSSEVEPMVDKIKSDIARIYCIKNGDKRKTDRLMSQQIDIEVRSEAELRAREELYSD